MTNKKFNSVMIDIETLAASKGGFYGPVIAEAKIIQLGATVFNKDDTDTYESLKDRTFVVNIDRHDQGNRVETEDTLKWWGTQSKQLWDSMLLNTVSLKEALTNMLSFLDTYGIGHRSQLWAQGDAFDVTILRNALDQEGLQLNIPFWSVRDSRTFANEILSREEAKALFEGDAHNAGDDAISQVLAVQAANRKVLGK